MNNKLLLAVTISTLATTSAIVSTPPSIGDSFDDLFKAVSSEFKKLPEMILSHTGNSLRLVSAPNAATYRYELAIPGKNENHVTAKVDHESHAIILSVHQDASQQEEQNKEGVVTRTISQSSHMFHESFRAPRDADLHTVEVTVQDGLLTLTIDKKKEGELNQSQEIIPVNKSRKESE
jgi:HSP20 family molecular chaperone IbpA